MAKQNRKKRLKKQLMKRNKEIAKRQSKEAEGDNHSRDTGNFHLQLEEIYSGAVKPVTRYINDKATMLFKCDKCGTEFFGKASHMIGKEHQRHLCNMPYSDKSGVRTFAVSNAKGRRNKRGTSVNIEKFNKMIWEDYSYQEIAKELQVNPSIVKNYFKEEGLI